MLKYLGHVPGVSIPTLHIGMLFSTSCWSSAPHGLPYIQYQHTGAPTIWHCVPKSQESKLQSALKELVPTLVPDKPCWLKEDWLMVNPKHLSQHGVHVEKCVQYPGQFVVVFPGAFTSTISCGYNVSESVHFALPSWLPKGLEASLILNKSEEQELFSMCSLLCQLVQDEKVEASTLAVALPLLSALINKELDLRNQLSAAGLKGEKSDTFSDSPSSSAITNKRRSSTTDDKICDVSNKICYFSMVLVDQGEQTLCIEQGVKHIQRRKNIKSTKLFVQFTQNELEAMLKKAKDRLNSMSCLEGSSSNGSGSSIINGASSVSLSLSNTSIGNTSGSKTRHNSRQSSSTS
ncbi:lysine-specific demethylase 5C [Elysia marginata]|uniref:Lysine-specific demethylase 5C n=1 Tax=Elysia marginata TaxID=1093978 RepID=A0AAV4ISN5_9GAST|nr:lysine-specific demethylase 5C [Elysia marginata]